MLPDMGSHHLAMRRSRIVKNPLDQIVAILVAGNINQRDSSAVPAALTDTIEVTTKKLSASNLEAFLNDFGSELVGAVLCCVPDDVVNGSASVGRGTMLANVLDAPVSELTMGYYVDVGEDFFNARAL